MIFPGIVFDLGVREQYAVVETRVVVFAVAEVADQELVLVVLAEEFGHLGEGGTVRCLCCCGTPTLSPRPEKTSQ